ncbi:MAG: hypothetical protein ACK4WH_13520 [Phycisphaerales bacterium]
MTRRPGRETMNEDPALKDALTRRDNACPGCGYSLLGVRGSVCPECGGEISVHRLFGGERRERTMRRVMVARRVGLAAKIAFGLLIVWWVILLLMRG